MPHSLSIYCCKDKQSNALSLIAVVKAYNVKQAFQKPGHSVLHVPFFQKFGN